MLNKVERYEVVRVFRICSMVSQFPIQVDLTNWQLKAPSTRKKITAASVLILYVLQVLYRGGSLGFATLFVPDVPLHELLLHAVIFTGMSMCVFWQLLLYVQNPSLLATYFRMTLVGNVGGSLGPEDKLEKPWSTRLREYSMQDLIATSIPYMTTLGVLTIIAVYVYDPSLRHLLYAALPNSLQNRATLGLCLLVEFWLHMIPATTVVPIWQLQVISFDLVNNQLRRLMGNIQNGTCTTRSAYRILRSLQLYVSILNHVNRYLIFTWKLLSISVSILSGYVAVAHFQEHPVFGVMAYVLLVDCSFIYTVIYEKAFKIPQSFDQAAGSALLHLRGNQPNYFRRQVRSIPRAGIKVGNFHTMERASTLNFMDFVFTNIVNMLVAYG